MGRHSAKENQHEQITSSPKKSETAPGETLQSGASMPTPAAPSFDERNGECVIISIPEPYSVEREMSHALPPPEAAQAVPEATSEAPRTSCQYCGIATQRVKAHERHCSLRTHEKTG